MNCTRLAVPPTWLETHRQARFPDPNIKGISWTSPDVNAITPSPTLSEEDAWENFACSNDKPMRWRPVEPRQPKWQTVVPLKPGSDLEIRWLAYLRDGCPPRACQPKPSYSILIDGVEPAAVRALPWTGFACESRSPHPPWIKVVIDARGIVFFPESSAARDGTMLTPTTHEGWKIWGDNFAYLKECLAQSVYSASYVPSFIGGTVPELIPMNLDDSLPKNGLSSDDPLHRDSVCPVITARKRSAIRAAQMELAKDLTAQRLADRKRASSVDKALARHSRRCSRSTHPLSLASTDTRAQEEYERNLAKLEKVSRREAVDSRRKYYVDVPLPSGSELEATYLFHLQYVETWDQWAYHSSAKLMEKVLRLKTLQPRDLHYRAQTDELGNIITCPVGSFGVRNLEPSPSMSKLVANWKRFQELLALAYKPPNPYIPISCTKAGPAGEVEVDVSALFPRRRSARLHEHRRKKEEARRAQAVQVSAIEEDFKLWVNQEGRYAREQSSPIE